MSSRLPFKRHLIWYTCIFSSYPGHALPWPDFNQRHHLKGHQGVIPALAYTPDGTHLLSCDVQGEVRLWNAATGTLEWQQRNQRRPCQALTMSDDGTLAVIAGREFLGVINLETGHWIRTYDNLTGIEFSAISMTPDMSLIAAGAINGRVYLINPHSGVIEPFALHDWGIVDVALMNDTGLLLTADTTQIRLYQVDTKRELRRIVDTSRGELPGLFWMKALTFSPDYQFAIAASHDEAVIINLNTGAVQQRFSGHQDEVVMVSFVYQAANGFDLATAHVITGGRDRTIIMWDIESGEAIKTSLTWRMITPTSIAVSPLRAEFAMGAIHFNFLGVGLDPILGIWSTMLTEGDP